MIEKKYQLVEKRVLTDSTYILSFERDAMQFEPGQHLLVGKSGDIHHREYSIYSGTQDKNLEILVKEVIDGQVSKTLNSLPVGESVEIQGPLGFFTLEDAFINKKSKFLFVASGTGISPFHSMIKSIPNLNYTLLHGIRHSKEAYGMKDYDPQRYVTCVTGDENGDFHGRVTKYIKQNSFDKEMHCYLCGNFNMIREALDLLEAKGIPQDHLHAEVYF